MAASTKWGWSRSNPIDPEFATSRGRNTAAGSAIALALLLHAGLLYLLLQQKIISMRAAKVMDVQLVRLPPPTLPVKPAAKPKPVPIPTPLPKPIIHITPVPVVHVKTRDATRHVAVHAPPPAPLAMHFNPASPDTGLGLDLSTPKAGTGQGSLSNFEDSVNQRIAAAKTYPPGIKGIWNECVENYRVTVAANGALISYKLYGCHNPFLDSAARAAILLAAPYPVPPNFGGTQYDVYGSLIFKHR